MLACFYSEEIPSHLSTYILTPAIGFTANRSREQIYFFSRLDLFQRCQVSYPVHISYFAEHNSALPPSPHHKPPPYPQHSTMAQSDLDLLLEMGFERPRAELAVKKTGGCK